MFGYISKLFSRFINRIKYRFISSELLENPINTIKKDRVVHEDGRYMQARSAVKKAFEAQEKQMKVRALKSHDPTCKDPRICKQIKCFKRVPDKIVKKAKVLRPVTKARLKKD